MTDAKINIETENNEPKSESPDIVTDINPEVIEVSKIEYENLKIENGDLKNKNLELSDKYLRTLADTENFKKRQIEQTNSLKKFAVESIVLELLPVIDNFNRAFAEQKNADSLEKAMKIIDGLKMINSQIESALTKFGVEKFESLNKKFDPQYHNAIQCEEVEDEKKDEIVLEEFQTGYKLRDKVIRTSMVKVGKLKK
ncbi:MAG TPA: nucleotide exchange factor GrpE [bacterium]|nr:nucleotide exchange factor GrpE [bacterium]HPN31245.1 nucleotide exchange factor GrpE [bacterium]